MFLGPSDVYIVRKTLIVRFLGFITWNWTDIIIFFISANGRIYELLDPVEVRKGFEEGRDFDENQIINGWSNRLKDDMDCNVCVTKGGSKSTAQQHGGERTFLQKEAMYLLYTPSVILPYF